MSSMTLAQKTTLFWIRTIWITLMQKSLAWILMTLLTVICVDFVLGEVEKKLMALTKSLLYFIAGNPIHTTSYPHRQIL